MLRRAVEDLAHRYEARGQSNSLTQRAIAAPA